jgi:nucleotide-binding universal stress UspA family protein
MKKILCPVDFSENAMNAIHYAHEIAALEKATLILFHACRVHVIPDSNPYFGTDFEKLDCNVSEEDLGEIWKELARNRRPLEVQYKGIVKNGFLVEELVKTVEDENVDLIIMGTEGAHGLNKVLFGSITASIIEKVGCPVLVVPGEVPYKPIQEIVFSTDLRHEEQYELQYTIELARLFGAHISMLHVKDHVFEEEVNLVARMEAIMNKGEYSNMSLNIDKSPSNKEGIYSFAEKVNADIIVMTTHTRNFIGKLLSKSLTKEMAFSTHIPLLVFHKEHVAVH